MKSDLMELKKKLIKLSENDKKQREDYLVKLQNGELQGPFVGDYYVDKLWVSRYSNPIFRDLDCSKNLYQTYFDSAKDRLDEIAVCVNNTKDVYTHRQIIEMVDNMSGGLKLHGVDDKSKVGLMLNGSVEEVVALLALFKLGAQVSYVDYMKSVNDMKESVNEHNYDYIFMEECFLPLNPIINEKNVKVIVADKSNKYLGSATLSSSIIMKNGVDCKTDVFECDEDKTCIVINSSGTTGKPKPICHTCNSVNNAVKKMLLTDYPLEPGNVVLKNIPSQIGLGVITSLYTGLVSGTQVIIMESKPDPMDLIKDISDFIIEFPEYIKTNGLSEDAKINIFSAPMFVRGVLNDERVTDLSRVGSILAAGSKIFKEELDNLELLGKSKGLNVPICNGYGQNEMAGAIALNTINNNLNGSAGYPTYGTDVLIVDPDTHELLTNNEVGLVLEKSSSKFKEYENMPEKTEESKLSVEGVEYFNTCDLGYVDDNGFLHITGRTTRVVIRCDFKLSLDDIEKKIRELDIVNDCAAIKDDTNDSMEGIILYVDLKDNNVSVDDIRNILANYKELSPFEQPTDIVIIDRIPFMDNGKINYKLLENEYKSNNSEKKLTRGYHN